MEPKQRSRTLELPAIMRALHQTLDDDPKILSDAIAPRLIEADRDHSWLASLLDHPSAKLLRAGFVMRARYAEDCLAEGVERGVRQYVVLGAGLDTFAYRQPEWARALHVYEVDHPSTQQWKREKLKAANIAGPRNLTFVAIDFERASLPDVLRAAGFKFEAVTLCSWMGVTQYLSSEALDATFRFILSLPRSSEIVFSFILPEDAAPPDEAEAMRFAAQRTAEIGEPWLTRFRADELEAKLEAMDFSRVVHFSPDEANRRYFANRRDGLETRYGQQLMRAIV